MTPKLTAALTLIVAMVAAALGIWTTSAPPVVPDTAAVEDFSAARAQVHLRNLAKDIHPLGSEENATVRAYLVAQLRALGVEPQLQEAVAANQWGPSLSAGSVTNVLARVAGSQPGGKAVLLMAHYDSARSSYGAGDDGSGVAALLESLRALRAGPAPRNDVIFLFTDGEEAGLLGARAFIAEHPWMGDVGVVVNLEARGSRGPALMFETSPGNGRLISVMREHVAHPIATSYSYEIYKRMPNDTDFTPFKKAGVPGMNVAFIHDDSTYHLPSDDLDRLDLASVQHQGEYALALARGFGSADLSGDWAAPNASYFNVLGIFVSYPGGLVMILAAVALLAALGLLVFGMRGGAVTLGGFLVALVLLLLGAVVVAAAMFPLTRLLYPSFYNFRLWAGLTSVSAGGLALALVASGMSIGIFRRLLRRFRGESFAVAGLVLWSLLGLALALVAPGGSYLFTLPALFALPAAFVWLASPRQEAAGEPTGLVSPLLLLLLFLSAAVAGLLWGPTLSLIGAALFGGAAVPLGLIIFLLLAGLLAPALTLGRPAQRAWLAPIVLVLLGLGLALAVRMSSTYDEINRRPSSLLYAYDAESGEAHWVSYDPSPSPWAQAALGEAAEAGPVPEFLGSGRGLVAPASIPTGEELLPSQVSAWRPEPGGPVHLRIAPPRAGGRLLVRLRPSSAITSLAVEGREVELRAVGEDQARSITYFNPPAEGIELTLGLAGDPELTVEALAQSYGLSGAPGASIGPRPADTMGFWGWNTDSVFIRNQVEIQTTALPAEPGMADEEAMEPDPEAADEERKAA